MKSFLHHQMKSVLLPVRGPKSDRGDVNDNCNNEMNHTNTVDDEKNGTKGSSQKNSVNGQISWVGMTPLEWIDTLMGRTKQVGPGKLLSETNDEVDESDGRCKDDRSSPSLSSSMTKSMVSCGDKRRRENDYDDGNYRYGNYCHNDSHHNDIDDSATWKSPTIKDMTRRRSLEFQAGRSPPNKQARLGGNNEEGEGQRPKQPGRRGVHRFPSNQFPVYWTFNRLVLEQYRAGVPQVNDMRNLILWIEQVSNFRDVWLPFCRTRDHFNYSINYIWMNQHEQANHVPTTTKGRNYDTYLDMLYNETIHKLCALIDLSEKLLLSNAGPVAAAGGNDGAFTGQQRLYEVAHQNTTPGNGTWTPTTTAPTNMTMTPSPTPGGRQSDKSVFKSTSSGGRGGRDFDRYMTNWLCDNWMNPYPDEQLLQRIATESRTSPKVVSTWLMNARGRKWRPAIVEAYELNRPASYLMEDSMNIFRGMPLREVATVHNHDDRNGKNGVHNTSTTSNGHSSEEKMQTNDHHKDTTIIIIKKEEEDMENVDDDNDDDGAVKRMEII